MAKRKLHHLHKVKIHHNRWLIWAISYALIVAVALVAYIKISDINIDAESQNNYESWRSYKDSTLGFGLRYPGSWAIEADSSNSVNFLPSETSDGGVNVTITPLSSETSIRRTLKIAEETGIMVNKIPAVEIKNDLGNSHGETVVMVKYRNQLYVVRGSEDHVKRILETFYFLTK
jgi:hypothetical protein